MKKTFTKKDEEFQIFNEFWNITQEFYEPESSDKYWQDFLDATVKFENNHKDNLLCNQMIVMLMDYLEKKYRKNNPSRYANKAAYIKLLAKTRYAYKEFLEGADQEDRELLKKILDDNKDTEEGKLLAAVIAATK